MSARNACRVIVAGEKKSFALSSLSGKPGTFIIPAYSTGGLPPTAWVISAVIDWLGSVLRSVQESPPSFETKMGAVVLLDPPGLGVNAEAAMSFGSEAYNARNGSASCQVSPLSEAGIRSTTRTPASLAGVPSRFGVSQATHRATATTMTLARITLPPPFSLSLRRAEGIKITPGTYRSKGAMHRTRFLALALLSAVAASLPAQTRPRFAPARLARIDRFMQQYVDSGQIAGAVGLVLEDGRVVYQHAVGWLDKESGRRMTPDALFRIASQTKALTTVAILSLVEQGSLAVGDPVSRYIPAFAHTTVATKNDTYFFVPRSANGRLATVYLSDSSNHAQRAPDGPRGQGNYVDGPRKSFAGGAGLISTAADYARFLEMLRNGGALGGVRILAPHTVELMTHNQSGTLFDSTGARGFGFGFQTTERYGANGMASVGTFSWGGAYGSGYSVDPVEHLVIVFMINQLPNRTDIAGKFPTLVYQALVGSRR